MALTPTVTPGIQLTDGFTLAELNLLGVPSISISGSVAESDIATGAVTASKSKPGAYWHGTTAGTAPAYTVTLSPAPASLADGLMIVVEWHAVTTGATTLNVNSLGAKSVKKYFNSALGAGDIAVGQKSLLIYELSTDAWQIIGTVPQGFRYAVSTGAANAYVVNYDPAGTALGGGGSPDCVALANISGYPLTFKANFANTGAATLAVDGLTAKAIRKRDNRALESGDIKTDQIVTVVYDATLDTFSMVSPVGVRERNGTVASSKNLVILRASVSTIDIDADEIMLREGTDGDSYTATSVNLTVNIASAGANGLDTGAEAGDTWYYLWVIYNPATGTVAGLISTSSTAPTMPSGYTFKALVGVARNDGSSNFVDFYQGGRKIKVVEQVVFATQNGVTSYTSQSISSYVPPIARMVTGIIGTVTGTANRAVAIAGNSAGTLGVCIVGQQAGATAINSYLTAGFFEVPLATAQTVWWRAEDTSASTYRLSVTGYEIA